LVNETIAEAKRNYYIHKLQHSKNNKNTWTILRELGIGKIKPTLSCDTDLDDLNHKFLQSTVPEFTNNTYLTSIESCDRNNCDIIFSFNCVSQCDVLRPILSIKSKATGLDEINPKFLTTNPSQNSSCYNTHFKLLHHHLYVSQILENSKNITNSHIRYGISTYCHPAFFVKSS